MNNLTKDELKIIVLDMDTNILKAPPLKVPDNYLALREKIQSLIDNYCEHENVLTRSEVDYVKVCMDCDKIDAYLTARSEELKGSR